MKPFEGKDTDYINRKEWEGFMFMFMFMKADRRGERLTQACANYGPWLLKLFNPAHRI